MRPLRLLFLFLCALTPGRAQDPSTAPPDPPTEKWNLFYQATSIGQYHPSFPSLYEGANSLPSHAEADVSLTTTFFLGYRIARNTLFFFDPEIAGGRGFGGTLGMANFPNGEITRVATATPKPYIARLFITQDFGFGDEKEAVASDENQLGGTRPATRLSITAGRFSATDYFDDNRYSHDPRTQFTGWAIMYNGAWDYPADSRGYTWGLVTEFHTKRWSLRYGGVAEPKVANGLRFDRRIFVNHGQVFEGELDGKVHGRDGAVRFLTYFNRANAGNYAQAIAQATQTNTTPDITATRKNGTLKYGFGISADQQLSQNFGVFLRLGWNDGKTETFAFTPVDRLASGGISCNGAKWGRKDDTAGTALTVAGISGVHALYLQRGGLDFLIGDGNLTYAPEIVWETYYNARLFSGFFAGLDLQHVNNPAYNQDRGPLWVYSLRLHMEFAVKK